jgi:hypothetical protein
MEDGLPTILDPKQFIYQTLIRELGQQRGNHIHPAIKKYETIKLL